MIKLMKNNKNVLLWEQVTLLSHSLYCKEIEQLSPGQLHNVLGRAVTARIMEDPPPCVLFFCGIPDGPDGGQ